jgi:hypothetical protein
MTTRQSNIAQIRKKLDMAFDHVGLLAFCFDYFPYVYDRFSQGMRKDDKITLLLDHCRRHPTGFNTLLDVVRQEYFESNFQREELKPLIDALEAYLKLLHLSAEAPIGHEARWVYPEAAHGSSSTDTQPKADEIMTISETIRLFFEFAGFELVSHQETTFLCKAKNRFWQRKFPQPIFVELVFGKRLNAETIWRLRYSALQAIGQKPTIFVVVDRTPTDDGWLQIATMRAENVQVIPIDDTVISKGQEQGRQRLVLAKHLRRFLGNERDFYDVRDPVADRLNFFGREALANELMEALIEGRPLALFGLRKIGKSSLLKYLRDKLRRWSSFRAGDRVRMGL